MRAAGLLLLLLASPAAAADCRSSYQALALRNIQTVEDYAALEHDFLVLNSRFSRGGRPVHAPPSISVRLTADNFADKAADLRKVARARSALAWCQ